MNFRLDAALEYANLGYAVFPCSPGDTPTPLTAHGWKDATVDLDQIEQWWTSNPSANIGLSTAGLVVIDVDGADNPWLANDPERAAQLAAAPTARTPRGGRHHVFRKPVGKNWRCSAGQLAAHVDVRTDGGFIVVPPSARPDGSYNWVEGCELEVSPDKLKEPPAWLWQLLDGKGDGPAPALVSNMSIVPVAANMIPEGQRNMTLARLGGSMRRFGMTESEINAALAQVNSDRCSPQLSAVEVAKIAISVASYPPDQISVAVVEDHYRRLMIGDDLGLETLEDGVRDNPEMWPPVIDGLLRQCEIMNVIASPKTGKSWLAIDLALAVATGTPWLATFPTVQGDVLVIDNELHRKTTFRRWPSVMKARGLAMDLVGKRVMFSHLRANRKDIVEIGRALDRVPPRRYKLIIFDAFYRFVPLGTDENSNNAIAHVYDQLDYYAMKLECAIVVIHHTSKGNQSGKSVTDVGAGAGAQSRAADTHLVLRAHAVDGVNSLDAAVRTFPPVQATCLRWTFPNWNKEPNLDPEDLKPDWPRRKKKPKEDEPKDEAPPEEKPSAVKVVPPTWDAPRFTREFVTDSPRHRFAILQAAVDAGVAERRAKELLRWAEGLALVHDWGNGQFATVPPAAPPTVVERRSTKKEAVLALLESAPQSTNAKIARQCAVTPEFVRRLRKGKSAE